MSPGARDLLIRASERQQVLTHRARSIPGSSTPGIAQPKTPWTCTVKTFNSSNSPFCAGTAPRGISDKNNYILSTPMGISARDKIFYQLLVLVGFFCSFVLWGFFVLGFFGFFFSSFVVGFLCGFFLLVVAGFWFFLCWFLFLFLWPQIQHSDSNKAVTEHWFTLLKMLHRRKSTQGSQVTNFLVDSYWSFSTFKSSLEHTGYLSCLKHTREKD